MRDIFFDVYILASRIRLLFEKHWGSVLSLPQCFWIAPTVFLNRSHSVFVFLPQCFLNETLKLKMKHRSRMFQLSKVLIINKLKHKKWNMKAKNIVGKIYVSCKRIRDASIYTSKKISLKFYSWAIFFCFHLSGSNSRYLLSGVLGGSTAALFITSDIYSKKLIPCSLHEHASE